ncbi:MAG: hypothetical protein ACK5UY_02090 [Holosporales bacterium]
MVIAKDFFNSAANKQTATAFLNARFVKEGETAIFNVGINIESRVEEDGWYIPLPVGQVYEDFAELEEHVVAPQSVKHFELPEEINAKKVAKGASYVANVGFLIETSTDSSGYILKEKGSSGSLFIAEAHYAAVFGDQQPVEGQALIAVDKPIPCIVLEQEVTFDFIAGEYTAPAGFILYENEQDEDGYTVVSPMRFLRDHVILK